MSNVIVPVLLVMATAVDLVGGGSFESPRQARQVVRLLENAPLNAFAAEDPERLGHFVAVLYAGHQLLVIETAHPSAAVINGRIRAGLYREVYLDLQGAPVAGKFFVEDAHADGLLTVAAGTGAVDVVYGEDGRGLFFNADAQGQHLSDQQYNERFTAADARYAHMLTVLRLGLEQRAARTDLGAAVPATEP